MKKKIILASASPRRKDLLKQIGLEFSIIVSDAEEIIARDKQPNEVVEELAFLKAFDVSQKISNGLVIGADTIVVFADKILGKPSNKKEAKEMLQQLSGKTHQVLTGVAIIDVLNNQQYIFHETTDVTFRSLESKEIDNYIFSGEPMDKAGSYGAQGIGALFVQKIDGCYFNVVGLPIHRLALALKEFGVTVL